MSKINKYGLLILLLFAPEITVQEGIWLVLCAIILVIGGLMLMYDPKENNGQWHSN